MKVSVVMTTYNGKKIYKGNVGLIKKSNEKY